MALAELQPVIVSCGALAEAQGRWTELVYTINGGIVAIFFLMLFGAVVWSVIKRTCGRLLRGLPRQADPTQAAADKGQALASKPRPSTTGSGQKMPGQQTPE